MRLAILPIVTTFLATPAMAVEPSAMARLVDTSGKTVGEARFSEGPRGVLIEVEVSGLPAGAHGTHLHAVGTCEDMSAGFKAAQGHVKGDAGLQHGLLNPNGAEVGDLPNLYVASDGTGRAQFYSMQISLSGLGGRQKLLDENGSSFMIHAGADDHTSQPIGGAGDRIACGALEAIQ